MADNSYSHGMKKYLESRSSSKAPTDKEPGEKGTMTESSKTDKSSEKVGTGPDKTHDKEKTAQDTQRDKSKDKNPDVPDVTNPDSPTHKQFEDIGGGKEGKVRTSSTQPNPDAPVSMSGLEQGYLQTRNASRDANPDFKPDLPAPLDGMRIPDGAMDPNDVKPGYGPLEGSPDFNDPTKLANPNNPNSPVNRMYNVSNPANMPQNQSQKPPSETRILGEKTLFDKRNPNDEAGKKNEEKRKGLMDKVSNFIQEFELESNIPQGHEYWQAVNELRSLNNP